MRDLLAAACLAVSLAGCSSSSANPAAPAPGDAGADAPAEAAVDHGCVTDTSPGDHTFTCEGFSVDVHVPDACASGCGLVLDVHGALETGAIEESHMAIVPIAKSKGYVVVQPTAHTIAAYGGPYWAVADDDHVLAILDTVARVFQSDPSRTHMTGFSQGGYMTWRFLCKHADRFASVAPGGAGLPVCGTTEFFESCAFDAQTSPSRQIDVLFLAGRQDGVVPYSCMSQERDLAIAAWGLSQSTVVAGDTSYTRTRYANAQGTVMETLEHDYTTDPQGLLAANKGHCYPGSNAHTGTPYDQLACVPPNAFAWGAEVMSFFAQHPKK